MKGIRPDWQKRVAAWKKRDDKEQHERLLKMYFSPQFLERNREEAEDYFSRLRPEIVERLKQKDAEREEKFEADLEKYISGDHPEDAFSAEEESAFHELLSQFDGPSFGDALEMLALSAQREEKILLDERHDLERERQSLDAERQAFESAMASAADVGEVKLDFRRGKDGKITSPVRLHGPVVGEYALEFVRGSDGRIESATIKPRG